MTMAGRFRLGVDVGGTFTDAVLISEATGETQIAKVPSTPADPSTGFMNAVDRILDVAKSSPHNISYLVHGTTVATNSLIEGKTSRTAFITTGGFRDMLELARQVRPSLYDVHFEKPPPLVPRNLCFEVQERLDADGNELEPLDEPKVREIAAKLSQEGVISVAVCFLHSYRNPAHERRVAELLLEHNPDLIVSLSSSVCPEFREYFRASTTVVNACIRPVLESYLQGIEKRLRSKGMDAELLIMQSNGGVLTFKTGAEKPAYMVESGPAAGVIVSSFIAGGLGYDNVISFDMGGTTAKVGLILDGRPKVTKEFEVGAQALPGMGQSRGSGYPILVPVIDLVEIGAGGGSIAWVDSGGILRVGPQSAGADPGPICYGMAGEEPTITDANLVLGRLNPEFFLGGEMSLDIAAARKGILEKCAEPLEMDVLECANGIVEIANAKMTNALRIMTLQRGYDPRELVMVAFGGAGPLHASRLCAEMQISLLIVPPSPGTASALGLLVTDLKHEFSRSRIMQEGHEDIDEIDRIFSSMEEAGGSVLNREGLSAEDIEFRRQIEMRYSGQSSELAIDCAGGSLTPEKLKTVRDQFHVEHDRAYGHGYPDEPTELVNFRLTAVGSIRKPQLREIAPAKRPVSEAEKGSRSVFFGVAGKFLTTTVYDRARLAAGHRFEGPAIVEEMDSTTLVQPGFRVEVDRYGNMLVSAVAKAAGKGPSSL
jgi:N-methylhydantoinase A